MYELRNIVNSIKRNFDPNFYFGEEGLIIALPSIITGSVVYIAANEVLKTSQQILPKLGLYGGAAITVAGAIFLVDDLLFNSKLLTYILERTIHSRKNIGLNFRNFY